MAILQISKIQVRSGSQDTLPQLAIGEVGFCTDTRRVFIGNDPNIYPPANNFSTTETEILTAASSLGATGPNTAIQYNSSGTLVGSSLLTFTNNGNTGNSQLFVDGSANITGNLTVGGDSVTIRGNLIVEGNSIYANTSSLQITDPQIELNFSNTGNLTPTTANYSPGIIIKAYAGAADAQQFIGWTGPGDWANNTGNINPYGNIANSIIFGTNAGFANYALSNITPANIVSSKLYLTDTSANSLYLAGGANIVGNLTSFGNVSFAGNRFFIEANTGNVITDSSSTIRLGNSVFVGNTANIVDLNVTGSTNIIGNIIVTGGANIGVPNGNSIANGGILTSMSGNIEGSNAVILANNFFTLDGNTSLAVNSGNIISNNTTASIFDDNVTTLSIGNSATLLRLGGNAAGITQFNTQTISGNASNAFLFNTTSNINFGSSGNADSINIGNTALSTSTTNLSGGTVNISSSGTSNINLTDGNINVNPDLYVSNLIQSNVEIRSLGLANLFSAEIETTLTGNTASFSGDVDLAGITSIANTTGSGNSTTGALTVAGGVGIGQNLYVEDDIYSNYMYSGGNLDIIGSANIGNGSTTLGVITRVLSAGNTTASGTITGNWLIGAGSRLQATYGDLAEMYLSDNHYEPGTVVVFGGIREVTQSVFSYDNRVAGVISSEPAYVMNSKEDRSEYVVVAFTGRVPCKVLGPVTKGTVLVTSDILGTAQGIDNNQFKPGVVIGKSLEEIIDPVVKTIEVAVGRF